eukprot:684609-Prorocentrum_minimum.AAC.4
MEAETQHQAKRVQQQENDRRLLESAGLATSGVKGTERSLWLNDKLYFGTAYQALNVAVGYGAVTETLTPEQVAEIERIRQEEKLRQQGGTGPFRGDRRRRLPTKCG